MPNELAILEPRVLQGVVQAFDAPEEFRGLALIGAPIGDPNPTWEYDIIRPSRGATLIHQAPNSEGTVIDQIPLGHMQGAYAYKREKKIFNATTLRWLRAAGENEVAARNATIRVREELEDIRTQQMRAEEVAVWSMLQGTWTYTLENGATIAVVYGMAATHIVTVGNDWGGGSDTPLGDIASIKSVVSRDSGFPIVEAWMNENTMRIFIELTEVAAQLSDAQKQNFTSERTVPRFYGIDWIEYDGGYVNTSGTYVPYIPDDLIVFIATGGRKPYEMRYGPSADLAAPDLFTGPFSKTWDEEDPSGRQVLMELNYMPLLLQPDKIATLDITA